MIKRLVLENWRSHEKSEFAFGKGTNVLIGSMGAGKSSSMDAICFALFGTFPSLNAKKVSLDETIRNKPDQQSLAKVTLELAINGDEYKVKRTIEFGKGSKEANLWKNDALIEGPQPKRTTEKICELLKINYDLFSRAIYAEQNNIDYFLEIKKAERKQRIDELLNISKFENARKNLSTLIREISWKADEKSKFLQNEGKTKEIPALETEILESKSKESEAKTSHENAIALKKQHESSYLQMASKKQEHETLDSRVKQASGKEDTLRVGMLNYGDVRESAEETKAKLEELNSQKIRTKQLQDEKEKMQNQLARSRSVVEENAKQREDIASKIALIQAKDTSEDERKTAEEIEHLGKKIEELKGERASSESQRKEIEDHVHDLHGFDKCPTCETELSEEKKEKVIRDRKERADSFRIKAEKCASEIDSVDAQRLLLKQKLEELRKEALKAKEKEWLEQNMKKLEIQALENAQVAGLCEEKLAGLKIDTPLEDILQRIAACEKITEYYSVKAQLDEVSRQALEWKVQMLAINYDAEAEKGAFALYKDADRNAALAEQDLKNISKLTAEKNRLLEELKKIAEEIEKNKQEAEALGRAKQDFEILENVLRTAQTQLRTNFIDTTNMALTDVWTRIYPYGDYTELRMSVDDGGDYILQLKTVSGKWVNVEGITSGGERSIASLALRISFSLVLTQNLSWLVLDEPTHNLDKQAVSEFAKTLRDHLPTIVDQIFIITHEPLLEEAASAYLYRLDRKKEKEETTKVISEKIS